MNNAFYPPLSTHSIFPLSEDSCVTQRYLTDTRRMQIFSDFFLIFSDIIFPDSELLVRGIHGQMTASRPFPILFILSEKKLFKFPSLLGRSSLWNQHAIMVKLVLLEFSQSFSEKETLVTLRFQSLARAIYHCSLWSWLCCLLFKFVQLDTALCGKIRCEMCLPLSQCRSAGQTS